MKKFIIMAMTVMMTAGAYANITFNLWYEDARDHSGSGIPLNTVFKIIADGEGDGLDLFSGGTVTNDFVTGDDAVMFTDGVQGAANNIYMGSGFDPDYINVAHPDTNFAGDKFYVVWYEGLTNEGASAPGEGTWIGVLSDPSFIMPNDGDTVTFGGYPTQAEAINQANVSYYQVIPEPSTFVGMMLMGAVALMRGRRRAATQA